jgi:hypothetical protein
LDIRSALLSYINTKKGQILHLELDQELALTVQMTELTPNLWPLALS